MGSISQTSPTSSSTIFVAASNASSKSQQRADFVCSGSADQTTVASAVAALPAGGGRVIFSEGLFTTSSAYQIASSNILFSGQGTSTVFQSSTNTFCFAQASSPFGNITFENILFLGSVNNTVSVPTRARTTSGAGITNAIWFDGSLDTTGSNAVITNITIRNCYFRNCQSLPIRIFGITGMVSVTGCEFTNNQDVGFGFCQDVQFNGNYVSMSADNGVSISRGNLKATCQGNTFENICRDGIWISGFVGTEGPQFFSVTGNTIRNCGQNGIRGQDAPKFGTISGNEIHKGYFRGASDEPNDLECNGIYIAGYPVASAPAYTDQAQGISVSGNHIYQAPRTGILVDGAYVVDVKSNLIHDTGTQFFANGSTSILATNTAQNVGIRADNPSTIDKIQIQNNTIVDQRGTPYTNWGIYPHIPTAGINTSGNVMAGCRNASNMPPLAMNGNFGQGSDGAVVLDGTVTVPWASKSGSTYTLTRDVYCVDLTINGGVTLIGVGYIINCSGTYTLNGTHQNFGSPGSGATGGSGVNGNALRGGGAGVNGGTGAGANGNALTGGLGGNGGAGGNSGANTGGTGGSANVPGANLGGSQAAQRLPWSTLGFCQTPVVGVQGWAGGAGGGAGGGDGTNAGGGGGQGGGLIIINARYVVLGSSSTLKTSGGGGGNGVAGNAAGGGGGGGGLLIINTTSFTGTTPTPNPNCLGAAGGTSQGTGTAASTGANGAVYLNIFS